MRLNWGSGPHYAAGYYNLDVTTTAKCDLVVSRTAPFAAFDDETVDGIYAGHVLEHVRWGELPAMLAEARRVLRPGGELMVVGPDMLRTLERWKADLEPWELVRAVLEDDLNYQDRGVDWDGACHAWNCYEERVVRLLDWCEFTAVGVPVTEDALVGWPVVSYAPWQFAVRAVK